MKSNAFNLGMSPPWMPPKLLLIMKMIIIMMITSLLQVSASTFGQRVNIKERNISLKNVFKQIRNQTGYDFMYDANIMKSARTVNVELVNSTLEEALRHCLSDQNLSFEIKAKSVTIKEKSLISKLVDYINVLEVTGKVIDEDGKPIPGASIRIKGTATVSIVSNSNGEFKITVPSEKDILLISYVGYKTQEVKIDASKGLQVIKLEVSENNMKDVVITGTGINRKKESFTGATATFSGEQLKAVGNQNIIQGLRALDPSFIQLENNSMGSNPNALPDLEIRGQTSISSSSLQDVFSQNPNQPLFILDGFETDLRTIMDLDMNMVASATILKDAASTVLYGSRASNGVIVIETIKPKYGKLQFAYVNDSKIELPDLSSYNMMNAAEKLEFERLAGRYTSALEAQQLTLDARYSEKLAEVRRGVDSYWLGEPLRNGISHRHSINASGGDEVFRFNLGVSYKDQKGAMKGSGREDWGGNLELNYRKGNVNISNRAYVKGYSANESPYGNYSTWVNTNPYYRKEANAEMYLGKNLIQTTQQNAIPNPFYNAALNSFDKADNLDLLNNTQVIVDFSKALRFQSSLQLAHNSTENTAFISPQHTMFLGSTPANKGTYNNRRISSFGYTLNGMLTYSKVLNEAHFITANLRGELQQANNKLLGFAVTGYPDGTNGNPRFSYGYQTGARPSSATALTRRNSILGSLNYSYFNKYNFDLSYTYDGSTAFGANRRYSPYYSVGTSWNLNREHFLSDVKWIDLLRLRVNVGETGNQNFGSISSVSTYDFNEYINRFGQGVSLSSIGNPDLEWQKTRQISYGMDGTFLNSRLNIQVNAYNKLTAPLVVSMTTASSSGVVSYPFNVGKLHVNGIEVVTKFSPVYHPEKRVVWTIGATASRYKQKFSDFSNRLDGVNKDFLQSNSLVRYRDEYSPTAIWAVPSLGIDPATGKELFRKKDGQHTFIYNVNDQVVVGNSRPTLEGMLNSYFSYKGFTATVMLRYVLERSLFNSALYSKVENISSADLSKNQDRRALYDRWKNPGDHAEFKSISNTTATPMSSRFVQKENAISGESISMGYDFVNKAWLKSVRLSSLRLSAYMNDIFYASNVQRERGISYPYTKSISFSLNAMF